MWAIYSIKITFLCIYVIVQNEEKKGGSYVLKQRKMDQKKVGTENVQVWMSFFFVFCFSECWIIAKNIIQILPNELKSYVLSEVKKIHTFAETRILPKRTLRWTRHLNIHIKLF